MTSEKRKREGIMLAYPLDEKRLAKLPDSIYIQPKINGSRCTAVFKEGKVKLYSSTGLPRIGVPHINKVLEKPLLLCPNCVIDGELYIHGKSVQYLNGLANRQMPDKETGKLQYYTFDTISDYNQKVRLRELYSYLIDSAFIKVVLTQLINKADIYTYCKRFIDQGYEGAIIRDPNGLYEMKRSQYLMKLKPRHTKHYLVKGIFQAVDQFNMPKHMAGGCFLETASGEKFQCGMGTFTHKERIDMWIAWKKGCTSIAKYAIIKYPELTERGVPFQPIITGFTDKEKEETDE